MGVELKVRGLYKEYPIFANLGQRLRAALSFGLWLPARRHVAVSNLDLHLGWNNPDKSDTSHEAPESSEKNDSDTGLIVGIVGPNGAGKSTFLRILSGVSRPSAGKIEFQGTIRSILELGVGFSAELTARQNIEHNGVLWNYSYSQLRSKTDEILEFAELLDYADQPIKTFSTGMQMRLAFSVATLERSDLLLVDEALAVGDASFQQKCLDRFRKYRKDGSLILIVSHDMNLLRSVCDEMVLLNRGKLEMRGNPTDVSRRYMDLIAQSPGSSDLSQSNDGTLRSRIRILNEQGKSVNRFYSGDRATISIELEATEEISDLTCGIHIETATGVLAFGTNSYLLRKEFHGSKNTQELRFNLKMNLGPGKYTVGYSLHRGRSHATDCFFWSHVSESFEIEAPTDQLFEGSSNLEPELEIRSVQD